MKAVNFLEWLKKIKSWHSDNDNQPKIINNVLFKIYEAERFYSQPFLPSMITELFEGWENRCEEVLSTGDKAYWFENINEQAIEYKLSNNERWIIYSDVKDGSEIVIPFPQTLNDFIGDCQRAGIELNWKQEIIEKYFKYLIPIFTQYSSAILTAIKNLKIYKNG